MQEEDRKLNLEELEKSTGGADTFAEVQKNKNNKEWVMSHGCGIHPPKYCCPKCGSWNVHNIDIGDLWVMRVDCHDCGYFGERD